jgi:hypothetical protein
MNNIGKEFEKYAIKDRNISSAVLHNYKNYGQVTNLTPYIIEERPLNVASMDVFSRLMMDRIIFLGEFTKPSSSALMPKSKYNSLAVDGISRKASDSVMSLQNILLLAIGFF